MGEKIRFQLGLGGEQPLHRDRGDRLPSRRHAQLLGQISPINRPTIRLSSVAGRDDAC